jgi:hypothetical protein
MVPSSVQKRFAFIAGGLAVVVFLTASIFLNGWVTSWVESPSFQGMLDRETSKGLKLKGSYALFHRVGVFGLRTDSFTGTEGYKTIVTVQAQDISGTFNPLGVVLRRWEIDSAHIKSGSVMLQKTEAEPGAGKGVSWPPWWALFWPYRVHLADVKVDDANILWKLRDKESGIYDTRLPQAKQQRAVNAAAWPIRGDQTHLPGMMRETGVRHVPKQP